MTYLIGIFIGFSLYVAYRVYIAWDGAKKEVIRLRMTANTAEVKYEIERIADAMMPNKFPQCLRPIDGVGLSTRS